MEFKTLPIQLCGRFQFEIRKAATDELVQTTGWIDNLVLNSGLNALALANSTPFGSIAIGTGDLAPNVNQTALANQFASSNQTQGSNVSGIVEAEKYAFFRRTCRFNAGVFNNTVLKEVGMVTSTGSNVLFNRALIVDALGNPTSITVLADEYLDVTAELRMYFDDSDSSGEFDLVNKDNTLIRKVSYIGRLAEVNNANYTSANSNGFGTLGQLNFVLCSGTISESITGLPTGTILNISSSNNAWKTLQPYVTDSFERKLTVTVPLNSGNGAIKSMLLRNGFFSYQIEFDSPIVKTANELLTFTASHKWARYTGVIN